MSASGQIAGSSAWGEVEICGADGGQGLGAGHVCRCVGKKGHDPFYGKGHGCSCGAIWADESITPEPVQDETSADLDTITAAARSWLYELEAEIIPGAGSQEDRDGYEEQAEKLRAALVKIGVEV